MNRPSQSIMEHVSAPRNAGEMSDAHAVGRSSRGGGASHTTLFLRFEDGMVQRASFQTFGCGYSIAFCSRLTEILAGLSVAQCDRLTPKQLLSEFHGVPRSKEFCADIAIAALHDGLDAFTEGTTETKKPTEESQEQ